MKLFAKVAGLLMLGCCLRLAYEGAFPGAPGPEALFAATAVDAPPRPDLPPTPLVETANASETATDPAGEAISLDNLPDDSRGWYLTVFTHTRLTQRERQVLDWFSGGGDAQLNSLRKQTHFNHLQPLAATWPRYSNLTGGGLPVVALQDATGKVIYKASGEDVPNAPWPLVKGIVDCIRAHCPHCPRPRPRPEPEPDEPDEPDLPDVPDVKPLPDVIGPNENTPAGAKDDTVLAVAAVFAVALAGSFIFAARGNKVI